MKILRRGFTTHLSIFLTILFSCPTLFAAGDDDIRITPVVKAVNKTAAAVVNVSTHEEVYERSNPFSSFGNDPIFERFFQDFYDNRYSKQSVKTHLGSGVIIDSRGYVLTNWHVIEKAATITVSTSEDREYSTELIGADPKSDLAVLRIESKERFSQVPLGDSENLLIGETVIAIGNPFGLSHTVTTGVVSALHRSLKTNDRIYENFIQTDASINPGNSGGPLLNIRGELIGINTAIYGQAEGIGFAIPVNTAKRIVADLLEFGEVHPPWLGIFVSDLTPSVAKHLDFEGRFGVIISDIYPGSPADKSGLKTADLILSIGDQKIKSKNAFKRAIGLYTANDTLTFKIFSSGRTKTVKIKAAEFTVDYVERLIWQGFGFDVIGNNSRLAQKYGLHSSKGLVISRIKQNGQAHSKGLQTGDIILKVQTLSVSDKKTLTKQIVKNIHRDSIIFLVQRGRYGYYVNFEF